MSKTRTPPAADAAGATPHVSAGAPPTSQKALLLKALHAVAAAVKFPFTPVPPSVVRSMDDAIGALAATADEASADPVAGDDVAQRLAALEAFADKLSADLPPRLAALEEASAKLQAAAGAGEKGQGDLLGEQK
jgi:hypothetical protein